MLVPVVVSQDDYIVGGRYVLLLLPLSLRLLLESVSFEGKCQGKGSMIGVRSISSGDALVVLTID